MAEPLLAAWDSFYVIVGSSAAALTRLLLMLIGIHNAWDSVVYVAGRRRSQGPGDDPAAFDDSGD